MSVDTVYYLMGCFTTILFGLYLVVDYKDFGEKLIRTQKEKLKSEPKVTVGTMQKITLLTGIGCTIFGIYEVTQYNSFVRDLSFPNAFIPYGIAIYIGFTIIFTFKLIISIRKHLKK